mgnify:CR=1 FL=1
MSKKLICLAIFFLAQAASAQTAIEFFSDDFESPNNYVTDNVAGTGWDGYFGWLPGETVDALNASIDRGVNCIWSQQTQSGHRLGIHWGHFCTSTLRAISSPQSESAIMPALRMHGSFTMMAV